MDMIKEIMDLCEAEVSIVYNPHKSGYQTAEAYLDDMKHLDYMDANQDICNVMIAMDRIICIQAYPLTPIGFYVVYHYDLEAAAQQMLNILRGEVA